MRLIALAIILSVSLILAPLAVEAQQAVRVPRVGFLSDTRQLWDEGFTRRVCVNWVTSRERASQLSTGMEEGSWNGYPVSRPS